MNGWEQRSLAEVIVPVSSIDPSREPRREFIYIDVSSISNETFEIVAPQTLAGRDAPSRARRHVKSGDVLFATIRPTLKRIAVVPPELDGQVCSTGYFVFRPKPFLHARFLFYFLMSPAFMAKMDSIQTGASYPAVNDAQVKSQTIRFPSLEDQRRIAALLDDAFEGLAKASANAEKNLANAQELLAEGLRKVFVRGDATWLSRQIGDVCSLKSGHTLPPTVEKASGDIPYLKVADMNFPGNEMEVTTSSRFLEMTSLKPGGVIPPGATIFPKRGGAIMTNKKRITRVSTWLDLNIMAVIPSDQIDAEFLHLYFQSVDMRRLGSGSSIPQINNYDIAPLPISMPATVEEQRRVAERLLDLRDQSSRLAELYQNRIDDIAELRQSLLRKAFEGGLVPARDIAA